MALGATPMGIARLTVIRTLIFVLVGVTLGLAASMATGQLLRSLLYGVSPTEPWAILSGAVVVIATATAATALPAMRAAHLDPNATLRYRV